MFTIEFEKIPLAAFEEVPPELRTEAFFRANELTNAYVGARARDVAASMGSRPRVGIRSAPAWEWIQRKIARNPAALGPSGDLRRIALLENPALGAAFDLIDAAAEGYPAFLRGEREGSAILFDLTSPALWDRYFSNENPIYAPGNVLAAHAAAMAVVVGSHPPSRCLRVLEVGAGCGSAAEALIARLEPCIASYMLTDISPGFLRKARERLNAAAPVVGIDLGFQCMDLNRPPVAWPAGAGRFDLVYAVNVLHAVHDLLPVLRGLRGLLAPAGALVLGECVRPRRGHPVHPEFIFQLLDELQSVRLDPELRPEPGFLDAASWGASLERAGFARVRFIPELGRAVAAYPEHTLAAIIAREE